MRPADAFFAIMNQQRLALTFDDVRLQTGYTEVPVEKFSLESRFSRNVPLKVPLVSAAMDTVTEARMAIAMAELGGLGIIHRNLSPEKQAEHVSRVKHRLNFRIEKPIVAYEDQNIEELLRMREERGFEFNTFPVLNREQKLVGIVTQSDFNYWRDSGIGATVRDIMSNNLITAATDTTIEQAWQMMIQQKRDKLPLVNEKGELTGMYVYSDVRRKMKGDQKQYNTDSKGQLLVGAAIGLLDDAYARVEKLDAKHVDVYVIDTAHADDAKVKETLTQLKKITKTDVVAGNVSQPHSARRLAQWEADGVKVGQGGGSICTTRPVAGVGCPQLTAVYNAIHALEEMGSDIPVCSDGGIRYTGDIPIAIGAGAHSVMMGKMLAGTKEAPGEDFAYEGRRWKMIRGMGSLGALQENEGSRQRYAQGSGVVAPEGIEGRVPYTGLLADTIAYQIAGLQKGMRYVGAATIAELRMKADFDHITSAGQKESHPHDIVVTKEAPNYSS